MKLCYEFDCTVVDVQMCIEDLFDKLAICMCPYIWNWSMSHTCRRSPYCTGKGVNHNRMTDSNWVSSSGGFTWSADPQRASYHFTTHTLWWRGQSLLCWGRKYYWQEIMRAMAEIGTEKSDLSHNCHFRHCTVQFLPHRQCYLENRGVVNVFKQPYNVHKVLHTVHVYTRRPP